MRPILRRVAQHRLLPIQLRLANLIDDHAAAVLRRGADDDDLFHRAAAQADAHGDVERDRLQSAEQPRGDASSLEHRVPSGAGVIP
jgi:hypothetical protein